jgi:hypothetical protein
MIYVRLHKYRNGSYLFSRGNPKMPLTRVSGLLYLYDKLHSIKPIRWECGGVICTQAQQYMVMHKCAKYHKGSQIVGSDQK